MIPKIIKRKHDSRTDDIINYWFDNGAWCSVDMEGSSYEYQEDEDDEETYISGSLEFENKVLIGYDGCYELPIEVIEAVKDLGHKIDEAVLPAE